MIDKRRLSLEEGAPNDLTSALSTLRDKWLSGSSDAWLGPSVKSGARSGSENESKICGPR